MIIYKAFRYRIYPTTEQEIFLNKIFGCARFSYNKLLDFRIKDYEANKNKPNHIYKRRTTKELRAEFPFLTEISSGVVNYEALFLDRAYKKFFRNPKQVGLPKFKKKQTAESFSDAGRLLYFKKNGSKTTHVTIPRFRKSPIKIVMHREMEGRPVTFTISRNAALEYYVSIRCEIETVDFALPSTGKSVGIKLEPTRTATLSDGHVINNPMFFRQALTELSKEHRKLIKKAQRAKKENRKLSESQNYQKQKLKVAKIHNRIVNQRKHFIETQTTQLIETYDTIAIEKNITQKTIRDIDKSHAANRIFIRDVADTSWYNFIATIMNKAHWYGRTVIQVDRHQLNVETCSTCGHLTQESQADTWTCEACGDCHNKNINASLNILSEGLHIINS